MNSTDLIFEGDGFRSDPPADRVGRGEESPALRAMPPGRPSIPARVLLAAIALYQRTLSPILPAVMGPACGCRFSPSCSRYAAGALREHGALRGVWLASKRLLKCSPFHPGGFDPVPPFQPRTPRCQRVDV